MDKTKKMYSNLGLTFAGLALSYVFKDLFVTGTSIAAIPYVYSSIGFDIQFNVWFQGILFRLFSAVFSAIGCCLALVLYDTLFLRYGRSFMPREEFVFGVSIYVIIANVIIGVIGLFYYLQPLMFVFAKSIINYVVYTVVFLFMFKKLRSRIPDYMVARVFVLLATPYMIYQLTLFL